MEGLITAWGRILQGYRPNISIEITRECPLRCPGCYAYGDEHLGGGQTLRTLADFKGHALIDGVLELVERHKPIHVSLVGGEPLVRFRELDVLLPRLSERGLYVQVVTSAVRPIPAEWASIKHLQICVSIDGLQPEHDARRAPATYDRILKHIQGHQITVHCTVTRQQVQRDGYLEDVHPPMVRQPERAHDLDEPLHAADRRGVGRAPAARGPHAGGERADGAARALPEAADAQGPAERVPEAAVVARTTASSRRPPTASRPTSTTKITPCQFGGNPDCASCGCIASAGLKAVARHRLRGGLRVGAIFENSLKVGNTIRGWRERARGAAETGKGTSAPLGPASA